MKTVNYRGVLVVFQIPEHWAEEYQPEGGGAFYDPDDASVTLRLNVTTVEAPRDLRVSDAASVLRETGVSILGRIETLPNGQAIAVGEVVHATERGTAIELHPILVARVVPPRTVRIANFVTTAVPSESQAAIIAPELGAIHEWVRACTISGAAPQSQAPPSLWRRMLGR
jgi:hypothetical protein